MADAASQPTDSALLSFPAESAHKPLPDVHVDGRNTGMIACVALTKVAKGPHERVAKSGARGGRAARPSQGFPTSPTAWAAAGGGNQGRLKVLSAQQSGGNLEEFPDREVERYRPQLQRYGMLAKRMGPEPVRLGLYFPLIRAWREWAA
jgi:hypothetical protein